MNVIKFKQNLFLLLLLTVPAITYAQNISEIDFENLDVEDLTEQQIQKLYAEAQARGLSPDDIARLAVMRGMPRSQAIKLRDRLNQISANIQQDDNNLLENRLRRAPPDMERAEFFDSFFGADSLRDSLRFYQSIALIKFRAKQDSLQLAKMKMKNKIFGYHFFSDKTVPFVPVLNIPTPQNYQLGPGDQVIIDIWGAAQATYQETISPEGTIYVDNIGPIYLNGLMIEEANNRLKQRFSDIYSGLTKAGPGGRDTYMQVSLGQIRSIQVTVIGEVAKPGSYTLPSLATIFNAVYAAGGPTVKGSFRSIEVIRGDSVVAELDLYDLFINGDRSENIRLRSQDIIKINPYINRVQITGEVKRPGIYEMKDSETLANLLNFAGGFTGEAYTQRIRIIGNTDRQRRIKDVIQPNFDEFTLRNGDLVTIQPVLDRFKNMVEIQGAVFREGMYELTDSTTVYSLIKRAEGLRGDAFANRGIIYREQDDYTLKTIPFNVQEVMQNPAKYNIDLQKNDLVVISSIYDLRDNYYVKIQGAVNQPDKYQFAESMSLEDIILRAGGFTRAAIPYRIEVARRLSETDEGYKPSQIAKIFRFRVDKSLELEPEEASFELQPFDIVYVRRALNYEEQQEVIISGEVKYPGTYSLKSNNARISDIIARAGGLTPDAYTDGATLYRKLEGLEYRTDESEENREGFFTQTADSLRIAMEEEEDKITISKIGIELPAILEEPGSKFDLFVREGDSIYVPKQLQTVMVKGGVFYPTSIRYDDDLSYMDYISSAGGYTELAKKDNAYIIYANGDVDRVKEFLFFENYPQVKPGATLVVPEKKQLDELTPGERVAIYSAVVSTLAVISTTIFQLMR